MTVVRGRHDVTLITGDQVVVGEDAEGKPAAQVVQKTPGTVSVMTFSNKDGVFVLPDKAVPYLAANRLDMNLFNVSLLVKDGYDDEHSKDIPLIATYPEGVIGAQAAQTPKTPAGAQARLNLPVVSAQALSAGKAQAQDFWTDVTKTNRAAGSGAHPMANAANPADVQLGDGITKLWLDGKAHASLDQSVPSIGAPQAWAEGYDGKGIKTAVLDTGIDDTHPDFAGRIVAEKNFSDSPDTVDRFGHGTHVASILAGSGAADGGKYKGVAPGASLLIGKVLGDSGSAPDSQIIVGMQWAVDQGAKVVSMSLGGDVTDGTDPLSAAVNNLSKSSGALFVIAAGNLGANRQIQAPGAADTALTVGATDRTSPSVVGFSSRGPRGGDFAVKPEITAPGAAITAARAKGNGLGEPVDNYYQSMSGTSMATPHVAGAAAILAQRHPGWTGQQLKDALVNTAATDPTQPMLWQGGGRVRVPEAVHTTVTATPSTVSLGSVAFVDQRPGLTKSKNVSFANDADQPVTLDLSAAATRFIDLVRNSYQDKGDGTPGSVKVSPTTVTVPAHGTATATVTADIAASASGVFGGYLTASQGGKPLFDVPVDYTKDIEKYRLGVHVLDRDGKPASFRYPGSGFVDWMYAINLDVGAVYLGTMLDGHEAWVGPEARTLFAAGHYALLIPAFHQYTPGEMTKDSFTTAAVPDITLDKDVTVNLDARTAVPVAPTADKPTERQSENDVADKPIEPQSQSDALYRQSPAVTAYAETSVAKFGGSQQAMYAIPSAPAKTGTFVYNARSALTRPALTIKQVTPARLPIATARATSAQFNGEYEGPLLNVGHATPDELAKTDVHGKAVLLQPNTALTPGDWPSPVADQLDRLHNAGALFALISAPTDGFVEGARLFYPVPPTPTPAAWIDHADGKRLAAQASQGQVTVDLRGTPEGQSPYAYFTDTGAQNHMILAGTPHVDLSTFTKVDARYYQAPTTTGVTCWRPLQPLLNNMPSNRNPVDISGQYNRSLCTPITFPFHRTEYVQASDSDWLHSTFASDNGRRKEEATHDWGRVNSGGHVTEDVFASPLAPCAQYQKDISGITRDGNTMRLAPSALCGPDLGSTVTWPYGCVPALWTCYDHLNLRVFQDGQLVKNPPPGSSGGFALQGLPADEHQYRILADVERDARGNAQTSTHATTDWTVRSARTASQTPLPLPQIAWDMPLDLNNNVAEPGSARLRIHPQHQDGAAHPAFTTVNLSVSYDDGKTWQQVELAAADEGWYESTITNQANGFVSLRAAATDQAGNTVTTTVTRAFGLTTTSDK